MAEDITETENVMTRAQRGSYSELLAQAALISEGYIVSQPVTVEPFDLTIKSPGDKRTYYVQVKTVFVREDSRYIGKRFVVRGARNNGKIYTKEEVDYFVAVNGEDVYMFNNTEQWEYWAKEHEPEKVWKKIG